MKMHKQYIISQLIGWTTYILMGLALNHLNNVPINIELYLSLGIAFLLGLGISHLYRAIIIRYQWLELSISNMIPRFILGSLAMSVLFQLLYSGSNFLLYSNYNRIQFNYIIQQFVGLIVLFLMWSLIYFFYHFFKNYKKEEIKNLKWEASKSEIELNKLKSQLNPHFMFNSMNSIRALVDENPVKAKLAITQLSNILRSNLLMGRQKLIPFSDELKLVKDYLAIEGYRYEERLKAIFEIDEKNKNFLIPPLMFQTIVENGIKHGIATLPKGGHLILKTKIIDQIVKIEVINHGQYDPSTTSETGFGLANTKERLKLIFGNKAGLDIKNYSENEVITEITIPLKTTKL